jgi:4-amino-4-deoxy-L-arabinose transferase-like glycosyltransferase
MRVRWIAVARGAALAAAALFLLAYLGIALLRMGYPFELEWMEGGILDHVRLAASGERIFAEPSLEFVSFLYPPLYYYVAAFPATVLGMEFHSLRLLSFVSSLACLGWIFAVVKRETRSLVPGLLAAGLYVATFDRSGGWMDLARVDSFFMCLLLAGVYGVVHARKPAGLIAAGLCWAGAALIKQSALVIALPAVLFFVVRDRARGVWWASTLFASTGAAAWLLDAIHDGWFRYYCWTLPRQHPFVPGAWLGFLSRDMPPLLIACVFATLYIVLRSTDRPLERRVLFLAVGAGMLGSSWSVTSVVGAWHNNLMPAFAAISILAGLGLHRWLAAAGERPGWILGAWCLLLVQFGALIYDPRDHLPSAADREAGESLVERLAGIDGEVFLPNHGYLLQRAGKPMQAHTLGMDNVFLDDRGPTGSALRESLKGAFDAQRWSVVILDSDGRYLPGTRGNYRQIGHAFDSSEVFWPVTGGRLRPEFVFVPTDR